MTTRYFVDTDGRGYIATMAHRRAANMTVFSADVQPCGATRYGDTFLSIEARPYEARATGRHAAAELHRCTRFSKKQNEIARDAFTRFILEYFEARGIVASRRTAGELADMGARYE